MYALNPNLTAALILLIQTGDMSILEDALSKTDCWR